MERLFDDEVAVRDDEESGDDETVVHSTTQSRRWVFTLNNFSDEDENVVWAWTLVLPKSISYAVVGREVGESGTPHFQGYIIFAHPVRLAACRKIFDRAHWEVARGTSEEASRYCKKDNDFIEVGEFPLTASERAKKGIADRWKLIKEGKLEELPPEHYFTYQKMHLRYHNVVSRDVLDNLWLYGRSGCGKSSWVRGNHPELYLKGMNKWWDGYDRESTVVLDDIDPSHTFLGYYLKIWSDHYPFNAETKGGMIKIRPARFIVTSQYSPEDVFKTKEGLPDVETISAVKRRFIVVNLSLIKDMGNHFTLEYYDELLAPRRVVS